MDLGDLSTARSVMTVLSFVTFIGIVVWAYSGRRKQAYDEAARMLLDEDGELPGNMASTDATHTKRKAS